MRERTTGLIRIPYFYKISERPVKKEPLDENDMKRLLQKELIPRHSKIRDIFIVQCFTGMSYSDIKRFDKSATYTDSTNTIWIDSSRVKTGVDFDVPILPKVVELIQKYDFKLPVPSNQKMNDYLKEIGDIAGISKKLTTHLARRTFASLLNEKGVNITAIQRMLGHTKITTTQRYITTNRQFIKDEMLKAEAGLNTILKKQ